MNQEIIVYVILAFVISYIPIFGRYVSMINTLVHENGHAIAALLLNGKVYSIKLFTNTGGEAITGQRGWFSNVVISYAGYTFSSLTAYVFFLLLNKGQTNMILYTLLFIAILNLILWIRNLYGAIWLSSFITLCGWTIYSGSNGLQTFLAYFFSAVLLTQSVSSSLQIFLLSIMQRKEAGDAASLARFTKVPALFWGFLFFVQALYVAFIAIRDHL